MNLNEKTTDLLNHLTSIQSEKDFQKYLKQHTSTSHSFSKYYNALLHTKNISLAVAVTNSSLEKHYAYQIINGTKANPGRDKIICLGIGAQMNIKELKHSLEITQNGILYAKNRRDAIIIKHINMQDWSVQNINEELFSYNIPNLLS